MCRTLIDLGSGVAGIMSSEFVKDTRIKTSDIRDDLAISEIWQWRNIIGKRFHNEVEL